MKKKDKITVIDSFSGFGHHEQFNACLALMLIHKFENVIYKLGEDQNRCLKEILRNYPESENIQWEIIPVKKNSQGKVNLFLKYIHSALINVWSMIICKTDIIIYAANNPFSAHAIKIINKLLKKRIFVINHGELEYISSDPTIPYSKLTRLTGVLMRSSIRFCPSGNIKYIVLGNNIIDNLRNIFGSYTNQFEFIDHPYIFHQPEHTNNIRNKVAIKNAHDNGENRQFIITLAKECPNVDFEIIASHIDGTFPNNISNKTKIRQLSREDYENMLATYYLIIYTYSANEYKLKVSGAIFDNINHEIPLIAQTNDYFKYIFFHTGDFGVLYEDKQSMLKGCIEYLNSHVTPDFSESYIKAKQIFSLNRVEKRLSDILSNI